MSEQKETVLNVEGMTCGSCVRHVEGALKRIHGVTKVEVKLREGRVNVAHDPATAPVAQMLSALENEGYSGSVPES